MSNYSTIIESLVSTRVTEGTLLRDYKGIISQLKKALLSKSTDVVPYDVNRLYLSLDCGWYGTVELLPVYSIDTLHEREDNKGHIFIYADMKDVIKTDTISHYLVNGKKVSTVDEILVYLLKLTVKALDDKATWYDDDYNLNELKSFLSNTFGYTFTTMADLKKDLLDSSSVLYKTYKSELEKYLPVIINKYTKCLKGLTLNSNKSVDMTKDTISICCIDTKKNMIYMSRASSNNERYIVNPKKKDWNGYTFDFSFDDVNNAIAKYKTLDCIGGFSFDFSGHAEGDVIHNGHRVLRYQVL